MWFSMVIIVKTHQSIILRPIIYELVMQIFKKKTVCRHLLVFATLTQNCRYWLVAYPVWVTLDMDSV